MEEVAAQAYTFFFAGFETSATTINFLLYECALNPSIQKKIQEDIDAAVERHGGITYECISEMEYLNKAVLGSEIAIYSSWPIRNSPSILCTACRNSEEVSSTRFFDQGGDERLQNPRH